MQIKHICIHDQHLHCQTLGQMYWVDQAACLTIFEHFVTARFVTIDKLEHVYLRQICLI